MSMYQTLVPTGTVDLDVDYKNLQDNFNQIDITYKVDHVALTNNTSQNGYHKTVHLVPFSTTATNPANNQPVVAPPVVAGIGELFAAQINDGIAIDEALYFQSGGGRLYQLTRNFAPVASVNGRTFLPGGLILQWFRLLNAVSQTLTPVTFAGLGGVAFPANAFNVQSTINEGSSSNPITLNISAVTSTGFSYYNVSSSARDFYILAIGN